MSLRRLGTLIVVGLAATMLACSERSPLAPRAVPEAGGTLSALAVRAASGLYGLSFRVVQDGSLQPVTSLTVSSQELILAAQVSDSGGVAAQRGTVTFDTARSRDFLRTTSPEQTRRQKRRARTDPQAGRG